MMDSIKHFIRHGSLVMQIFMGLVVGIALAVLWPDAARATILFGTLFVGALKAVAPLLVFVLVMSSIANHQPLFAPTAAPVHKISWDCNDNDAGLFKYSA